MSKYKGLLPKGFYIDKKYSVLFFIKQGSNAETYRVKGVDAKTYFLKLFNYAKLHRSSFDSEMNLLEGQLLKKIKHENIVSYKDGGELIYENKKLAYLVLDFISGETLAERISREKFATYYDVRKVISDVLNGLDYLHSLPEPIIHNEITPQNIMLDLSDDVHKGKIIDFGFARSFHQSSKSYNKEGLNLNYVASECFNNLYSPQSDIYSVGAVMYQLLFGLPPWFKEVSNFQSDRGTLEESILQTRSRPLAFPKQGKEFIGYDETVNLILKKALSRDVESRFQNANDFIQALNGEIEVEDIDKVIKVQSGDKSEKKIASKKAKGKGFDAIAGMDDLKAQLKLDVIDALHDPQEYANYGLTIPNGMLLYGPPGCGKTFFAKHFAEEVGFNFIHVNPGTLKSRYVNATEEKISELFQEAEKNAPTIIFIEEISGLFPSRDSDVHEMSKNAVDAMLAEMDRTGKKGIFVLCATNYPDRIDGALLRTGRLDKKVYLPPPDRSSRIELFKLYLINRRVDFGIQYEKLAELTDCYVSSDIEHIVNEASRQALRTKGRITMPLLEKVIQKTKPSVSREELAKYERIRNKFEGGGGDEDDKGRGQIGFKF